MLSQIVLIAVFLAVCIRNSEMLIALDCWNDEVVVNTIQRFSKGVVPIVVYTDENPLTTQDTTFVTYMNKNYNYIIVVDHSKDKCGHTNDILKHGLHTALSHPFLYMMHDGYLVKPNRVNNLSLVFRMDQMRNAAERYNKKRDQTSIYEQIVERMLSKNMDHPGIEVGNAVMYPGGIPVAFPEGNPVNVSVKNPVEMFLTPTYPGIEQQYGTIRYSGFDQGEGSSNMVQPPNYQAGYIEQPPYYYPSQTVQPPYYYPSQTVQPPYYPASQTVQPPYHPAGQMAWPPYYQGSQPTQSVQPTSTLVKPIATYPTRPETPETMNLLDSIDKRDSSEIDLDGSSQTPSQTYNWENYRNDFDEI